MNKKKGGFTLIELLIAITILVVVISIGINLINIGSTNALTEANKVISGFNNVESALNYYKEARGQYPNYTCSDSPPVPVDSSCLNEFIPYFLTSTPNIKGTIGWANTNVLYYKDNSTSSATAGSVYLCIKTKGNLNEYQKQSLSLIESKSSIGKVYVSTECGSDNDTSYGDGPAAITWWIVKR